MSDEDYKKLTARVVKGKAWINEQVDGWWSKNQQVVQARDVWFKLCDALHVEYNRRHVSTFEKHSKAWIDLQIEKAVDKWKHTLKAKRGPDPRTLPRESFG